MRLLRYTINAVISLIFYLTIIPSYGQLGISFDLKKPKEFDDRELRSEKSDDKKFTLPRRFIQNTVTRYNYFFNANNKLNEVIERAKDKFKDDFSKLLPFYNYTIDATAKDSVQLDSIMYKSESGIALHDLRNDWADNLYLLWGAAYYLRKDFDSAYLMFQFINYAFADKEKDGYYKTIGSSMDGNKAFSIATKEKTSLPKKIFAEPPSRNDAFIWQIRDFLIQDQFAEAASLIVTLKNDPVFPKRLSGDLNEVQAWWFYKQNMWDSAAPHLANALDQATNRNEKARWEYLIAQMYELSGKSDEAQKYYSKVISHTTDPVMEVYARLNSIRVNKSGGDNYVERNVAELVKMAKKDRYEEYRDIIYYMAAQMEIEVNNIGAAEALLQKSIKYFSGNQAQRNKAFLELAQIAYTKKLYHPAYNFYDSLDLRDPALPDTATINKRKDILGKVVYNLDIVDRQDSLQKLAAMPEEERKEFVKKLVKDLRKQQGLKEEENYSSVSPFGQQTTQNPFSTTNPKGDWYFYNQDERIKGHNDFVAIWGNRANTDNWRRSSTSSGNFGSKIAQQTDDKTNPSKTNPNGNGTGEISFDDLYDKIPTTPEKIKVSDDSISIAMFNLGKLYAQEIEDCAASVETFENLRNRFPNFNKMDEVLFNLYYCYNKNGETTKAEQIKKLMNEKYPKSNFTTIVVTGKDPQSKTDNPEATKEYEKIYDLFIEGNFAEAVAQKKIADSLYGKNYWTPQLLYIEAVYYIKQRQDSIAKNVLNSIITQFPKTKIADRAVTLLDVLSRRSQIEKEIESWTIRKPKQENNKPVYRDSTTIKPKQLSTFNKADSTKNTTVVNKPVIDTTTVKPVQQNLASPYSFTPDAPHYVMIVLTKVDPIFSGEAKNAFFRYNRETYYNKTMTADITDLDAENRLLLIGSFKNAQEAIDYINKAKPLAPSEIIPWLKGGKYIFSIITDKNLELLQANKDLENYKKFMSEKFPGKL